MVDITVPVPDERVAEFYAVFSTWLAGSVGASGDQVGARSIASSLPTDWGMTEDDLALAKVVWVKLSDRAKAMFDLLMDKPGAKVNGEEIAERLGIPNGKYGVAGVLAWPGRHCAAVGRPLPVRYEDGPVGGSANYWIDQATARLFSGARAGGTIEEGGRNA